MATARPYSSGNFSLDIDGISCGIMKKFEGLNVKAEVIRLANAGGYRQNAQLGTIKPEDAKLTMAGIMSGPALQWVKDALDSKHSYKSGQINRYNFDQKNAAITQFQDALLTKIEFPKVDGSSKDPAYMNIEFAAQHVKHLKGDGSYLQRDMNLKQKTLVSCNFGVVVDKVGADACKRINTFDPLSVKMKTTRDEIGNGRWYELIPGALNEMPNIKFTLAEIDCEPFYAWHEDFVVNGNCAAEQETSIELTYYDQSMKNVLMTVTATQCGIFNFTRDAFDDMSEKVARCTVEAYCEDIKWTVNA